MTPGNSIPPPHRFARAVEAVIPLALAPATLLNAIAQPYSGAPLIHVPCLITLITGHACQGCGLTRALTLLWHGQLRQAVALNPLSPLVLLLLLALFCLQLGRLVISQRELSTTSFRIPGFPGNTGIDLTGGLCQSSALSSRCSLPRE